MDSIPDEKTPEMRSPTETLVACMEDFGESEPDRCLVIYTNADGGYLLVYERAVLLYAYHRNAGVRQGAGNE